jgi:putative DNA primase/helicase
MLQVSIFKDFNKIRNTSLEQIIIDIREGKYKDKIEPIRRLQKEGKNSDVKELKKHLLAFTPSGVFKSKRTTKTISEYSGLVILDIDNLSTEELKRIIPIIHLAFYTYAAFISPRGNGIKIIVPVNTSKEHHKVAYKQVAQYYEQALNIEIDTSGSDISRLCFVSFDPNCYFNKSAEKYEVIIKTKSVKSLNNKTHLHPLNNDSKIEKYINEIENTATDITENYETWRNLGFAISEEYGESGREYYHRISRFHPNYNHQECDKQYSNCLKAKGTGINISSFYYHAKQLGIVNEKQIHQESSPKKLNKNNINIQNIEDILTEIVNNLEGDYSQIKGKDSVIVLVVDHVLKVSKELGLGLSKINGSTYVYNKEYWKAIDRDRLTYFLGKSALKIGFNDIWAKHFEFQDKLYKQFLAAGYMSARKDNKDTVKINLKNGTFEINKGKTRLGNFDPNDFLTYQLPFEYEPKAKSPMFEKYLNRVLPDKSKQMVIAEYLGSIFIKNGNSFIKTEKVLMLYGTGANGKSVLNEVVQAMLGSENISSYSLQSLTDKNGHTRAMIGNKLLNYSSEISSKIEAAMFKQLASGEPVEARLLYKDPFILEQYAKLMFNTNELPKNIEHTTAFFRRFILVEFDQTIPLKEQDKSLHSKIIANELAGVFNWVLEGLKRFIIQGGFTECKAVDKALKDYKDQSDNVQQFLNENEYVSAHKSHKPIKEIYPEYASFCRDSGYNALNKTNFIKRLKVLEIEIKRMSAGMVAYLYKNEHPETNNFSDDEIEATKRNMGYNDDSQPEIDF